FALDDERARRIFELCEEAGLPVLLHTGDRRYDYSNPNRLKKVLKMFPDTTFIGAHFGGWSIWEEATRELHGYDNLFVDSSSTFHWVEHSKVKDFIRAYGSDRVMFGSDFPMWDVEHEIRYMMELKLTDEEYENVFHGTAERVFGI
ncbi:MAG: amidohydrolase family protein, partial [Spirochaetales bacterium]|nr:amidohydrolase family protein [Spirochaetales bacterium]